MDGLASVAHGNSASTQLQLDLGPPNLEATVLEATVLEATVEPTWAASLPLSTQQVEPASPVQPADETNSTHAHTLPQTVVTDLIQAQTMIREQIERIQQLELALDQSLATAAEMRRSLIHQQFLEDQLASTEEIANIQQRAIAQLKKQLLQQQQSLEIHQQQAHVQTQSFQGLLATIGELTQGQHTKLEELRLRIQQDGALAQTNPLPTTPPGIPTQDGEAVYSEPLPAAAPDLSTAVGAMVDSTEPADGGQFQDGPPNDGFTSDLQCPTQAELILTELHQTLSARDASISQLETELHRAHVALQEQQSLINSLQAHTTKQGLGSPFDGELFATHAKIQELETQLSKQVTAQAMLQHACQELEQTRDRHQTRIADLEQDAADMQEQILKQAQQGSEYETAIQHWKDRYQISRDYLVRFKALVEQFSYIDSSQSFTNLSNELAILLAEVEPITTETLAPDRVSIPGSLAHAQANRIDVPDFLARRQRYRARS
jgi:hypothetical protein